MRPPSRLLVAVVVMGSALGCGMGGPGTTEPMAPPETIRYTALGDSLGTGAGAGTSYVDEYATWLAAETGSHVEVTNLAVDGWTSRDLLEALTEDARFRTTVADAHVLTWAIGGNDLLEGLTSFLQGTCDAPDARVCMREAVATASDNIDAALHEMLELRDGESEGLRTLDLYLPFMDDFRVAPHLDQLRPHLDEFNEHVTRNARENGVPVADVEEAFHGSDGAGDPVARGLIAEDGLHPSDRGHELIAKELAAIGLELGNHG